MFELGVVNSKKNNLSEAKKWLNLARSYAKKQRVDDEIRYFYEHFKKSGATFVEADTDEKELEKLLKTGFLSEAKKWLNLARSHAKEQRVDDEIKFFYEYLNKSGFTLTEAGTDEKKIKKLLKRGFLSEAKNWLKKARANFNKQRVDVDIMFFYDYLKRSGANFVKTDTNRKELKLLLKIGYLSEAKNWLKKARSNFKEQRVDTEINFFYEYLKKSGATLVDAGTDETELEKLLKLGYLSESKNWIKKALTNLNKQKIDDEVMFFKDYLKRSGFTLVDLGTDEKEIDKLLKK